MTATLTKTVIKTSDASVHLDAIRGCAALVVFLGHGRELFLQSGLHQLMHKSPPAPTAVTTINATAQSAVTIGHEAVVVFFVLSGYFVGGSVLRGIRRGSFSWREYLFQRLTRLWTALIPALCLGLLLDSMTLAMSGSMNLSAASMPVQVFELAKRLNWSTFIGNIFFLQGISVPLLGTNSSLWSLSYEFWYYLLFPLLVFALLPRQRVVILVGSALLLAAGLTFCGPQISSYFIIWLMGAAIGLLPQLLADQWRKGLTVVGVVLNLCVMAWGLKWARGVYLPDLLLGIAFSILLWAILHIRSSQCNRIYKMIAHQLSHMSYTLYLVHLPCFVFLWALLRVTPSWPMSIRSLFALSGIYAIVFALCALVYYCFERNTDLFRSWLRFIAMRGVFAARLPVTTNQDLSE